MELKLNDITAKKRLEMLKSIEDYEDIKHLIGCPQGELRGRGIDCFNCTKCLKYAIRKSMEIDDCFINKNNK